MKIVEVSQAGISETPHNVDVRMIYDTDSAQAVHITLQAGESLKPHITPVDVFFYVLEGTPDILVGDETVTVAKDNLIEGPKGMVHCISNNSERPARVLVVKAPRPTTRAKL